MKNWEEKMYKRRLCRRIAYCVLTIAILGVAFCVPTTSASAISKDELTKKALLNSLKTCGTTTYFKASINQNSYSKLDNLFTSAGGSDGKIKVPTMVGNTIKDGDLSCKQVLAGYHKNGQDIKGLTEYSGKAITKDKLTDIGYRTAGTASASSVTQECIQITYEYEHHKLFGGTEWKNGETKKYCFWVADGVINTTPSGDHNVTKSGSNGDVVLYDDYSNGYWLGLFIIDGNGSGKNKSILSTNAGEGDRKWADFKASFDSAASSINNTDGYRSAKVVFSKGTDKAPENSTASSTTLQFGGASSKLALLQFFAGSGASWDSVKFTESDKTTLLRAYVQQELDSGEVKKGTCDTLKNITANQGDKEIYVYQPNLSKDNYCILEGADKVSKKFNAPRASMDLLYPESFLTVVTALMPKEIADKNKEIRQPAAPTNDQNDEGEGSEEQASPCSQAGGALGWIICPTVQLVSEATQGIYEYIANTFLQMDPDFVNDAGTRAAWGSFRTYANIVFAIILSIILFSQITGFGVSNYGIKKMLPSLIVVAVLVNISFFLCEIAVDASNIIGYGAGKLFDGIKTGNADGTVTLGGMVHGAAMTFLTGAGAIGGMALAWNSIEYWLLPFALMILIAFISVVVFFILLGVRQAGIIILVTLAPVAIACYALPNTKKVFERWWKLLFSLLMVYPICGLLMSGGQFASRLLLNVGSNAGDTMKFSYAFVAVLLQAVPFFFVPSILRSSLQAMGNIGNRLSMLGARLGRSTTGAIRRSEGYKDAQGRMVVRNARRRLNREDWGNRHRIIGAPVRMANRAGERIRSGNGRLAEMANSSYNRRQARRINAVAGQRRADQEAAFVTASGLRDAERRERDTAMKNYESNYRGDDGFMNDFTAQSRAYEAAIDEVDHDPTDMNARARLRALQNVLGSSADGQDIIQNVLHRRLADAQSRGETTVSAGMVAAGQTLMGDHGGFKSGNRGLNQLSRDLASGQALTSKHGRYQVTALRDSNGDIIKDKAGNQIYENNHYGAAAAKGSAVELAGANDGTLDGMLSSIQNGNMNTSDMEAVYRNASEAITNDNISVKPENEGRLNAIRQAAYEKLQGQQVNGYTDNTGREFMHVGGNDYQYTDSSGNVHNYTRSGSGDMTEVGTGTDVVSDSDLTSMSQNYYDDQGRKFVSNGGGMYTYDDGGTKHTFTRNSTTGDMTEVGTGSEIITGNRMKTAADNFAFNYGNGYRNLHSGDTFKVGHNAPATPTKINLPTGWTLTNTGWVDITTGMPLSPMDARRADSIVDHNNRIDNNHP